MLDLSFLAFLTDEISNFINQPAPAINIKWSDIIDQDGSVTIKKNSIAITLVKIEKEAFVNRSTNTYRDRTGTNHGDAGYDIMPLLDINFYVQFAVYNDQAEAIRQLGFILSYFQSHPVITSQNVSTLNAGKLQAAGVDKLIFEIVNYSHQELSNLWSQLGAKYMPSVVYKMRMITVDAYTADKLAPVITNIDGTLTAIGATLKVKNR